VSASGAPRASRLARALTPLVLGAAIGTWGAACGIGGGVFAVPLLHYVWGLPLRDAVATSLVVVAATTSAATGAELLRPDAALHLPTVAALTAASFAGTRLGFALAERLAARRLKQVFCAVLLLVAVRLALGAPPGAAPAAALSELEWTWGDYAWIAAAGLLGGIAAPLLGVGGGLFTVPALVLAVEPLGYLGARAASLAMSAVNGWTSLALYQRGVGRAAERRTGRVRWPLGAGLAGGALAGAVLGVWAVHQPGLAAVARWLLVATLLFVSARFALDARQA
jgi:uncharacterized membrane protein YfcA